MTSVTPHAIPGKWGLSRVLFWSFLLVVRIKLSIEDDSPDNPVLPVTTLTTDYVVRIPSLGLYNLRIPTSNISKKHDTPNYKIIIQLALLLSGDIQSNPGPVNFGFVNCRSIRNKGPLISDLVTDADVDIFGITETHIRVNDTTSFLKELTPHGYTLYQIPRLGKTGGGVGFLVKTGFNVSTVASPTYGSFEHVIISVQWCNHRLNFASIYRPPGSNITVFLDEFMSFAGFISSLPSPTIISGDFNIHLDTATNNSEMFKALLESCNLAQHVDFPTHIHGHTLDLLITPSDFQGIANICDMGCISDHFGISCKLDMNSPLLHIAKLITFRQYHKMDRDEIKCDLHNTAFVVSPSDNASDLYEQYINSLSSILEKHAPLKTKCLSKPTPVWITQPYREAKRLRRQAERAWRKNPSVLNRSKLRRQISKCNVIINKSKGDFYTDIIHSNSGDSKKLWKELNNILHRKSEKVLPESTDDLSLANRFSSFFTDKIKQIHNGFNSQSAHSLLPDTPPANLEQFSPVTETHVHKVLLASPSKSCTLDPWPTFLVKEFADILLPSITKLVNCSLAEGFVPSSFKKAVVTPLIKKPSLSKDDLSNYRPVSGLCFMSKLLERVVASQIKQHLNDNNMGNCYQSAYKTGHSTETALLCIKNDIHISLAKGMPTALVLLDLSAAFDTIDHNTLLDRLSSWFGLCGVVLDWFSSYLTCRFQSVKVGDRLSDPSMLLSGVPQGSVLGPILFSLYTTPLTNIISSHKVINQHFYADDTQLYIPLTPSNFATALPTLQKCLADVQDWMAENKLKLNPNKTEFILLGTKPQRNKLADRFPVDILGSQVRPADKVRNLGVIFDADFSFSKHVVSVCRSCFVGLRDLRRIRRHLTKSIAVNVANALVSSRLDYCNSLLRSLSCRDLNKLQCVQNSLARIVTRMSKFSRAHMTPVLKSLHWLPIKHRIRFKTASIIFKFLNTGTPAYFSPHLTRYSCAVNTRRSSPDNLYLHVPGNISISKSKVQFQNSFSYDGPSLWNALPHEIRSAPTLSCFRRKLKTHLFQDAYPP